MSKTDMGRECMSPSLNGSPLTGASHDPTSETESASDENVVSRRVRTVETEVEEDFSARAPRSPCLGVLRSRPAESLLIRRPRPLCGPPRRR